MTSLYAWILYLHIGSVFAFLLLHGPSAAVSFAVRKTRDPTQIGFLVDLSKVWTRLSSIPLVLTLISGIILGFIGNWWRQGWIWAALILFLTLWMVMNLRGIRKLYGIRWAIGQEYLQGIRPVQGTGIVASRTELDARARAIRPWELTTGGAILLATLLVLMMFKPF
jgi:hypothetical protein